MKHFFKDNFETEATSIGEQTVFKGELSAEQEEVLSKAFIALKNKDFDDGSFFQKTRISGWRGLDGYVSVVCSEKDRLGSSTSGYAIKPSGEIAVLRFVHSETDPTWGFFLDSDNSIARR